MTLLIADGNSFIGGHLNELLIERGYNVITVGPKIIGETTQNNKTMNFIAGDINNIQFLNQIFNDYNIDIFINMTSYNIDNNEILITEPKKLWERLQFIAKYYQKLHHEKQQKFRYLCIFPSFLYKTIKSGKDNTEQAIKITQSLEETVKSIELQITSLWQATFNIPTIFIATDQVYGINQKTTALIPSIINKCIEQKTISIPGDGSNINKWIHIKDLCQGLYLAIVRGSPGATHYLPGNDHLTTIETAHLLCEEIDLIYPKENNQSYKTNIKFVANQTNNITHTMQDIQFTEEIGFAAYNKIKNSAQEIINYYLAKKINE